MPNFITGTSDPNIQSMLGNFGPAALGVNPMGGPSKALLDPKIISKILEYLSGRGAPVPGSQLGANALGEMAGQAGGRFLSKGPGIQADMDFMDLILNMFKRNPTGALAGADVGGFGIGRTGAGIDRSLIRPLAEIQSGRMPFYNMN